MDLTQYKLLIGNNIIIDNVEYGNKADVSEMCGEFNVEGLISSKHNHTLDSTIKVIVSLTNKIKELQG